MTQEQPPPPAVPTAADFDDVKRQRDRAEERVQKLEADLAAATRSNAFSKLVDWLSDHVDLWRRVLGTLAFVGVAYAAHDVFGWIRTLKGEEITWPRAILGASVAGFLLAVLRLVDRLTMRETLLAKIEEGRKASPKEKDESEPTVELVRAVTELVSKLAAKE